MSETSREEKQNNLVVLGTILAALGLGVCIYSLYHHIELKYFGDHSFVCNMSDTLSCDDVANSRYSEDPWGNPLGVSGIGYFLGLALLLLVGRFKYAYRRETLQAYAALVATGIFVSIGLGLLSHFEIGKLCPTCMVIYGITFFQGVILYFCRDALPRPFSVKELVSGLWYGGLALIFSIALFQMLKPSSHKNLTLDVPKEGEQLEELKRHIESLQGPSVLSSLDPQVSDAIRIDSSAYSGFGEDYRKGSDDAKVKIVEFADFQCPACATASQALRQMATEFGDQILVVFKNYPLDSSCNASMEKPMHPYSCKAATLARCAGSYGKFWDYMINYLIISQK